MARKTNDQLMEENEALKAKLEEQGESAGLVAENESLKKELRSKAEVEAEMTQTIKDMEDKEYKPDSTGKIAGTKIRVMTATQYAKHSKENGRTMGRPDGVKTKCSIEELRSLINSKWTPSMIMEKHGMSAEGFKQLIWKLSKSELRKNPIKFDITRDTIDRGAGV